MNTTEFNNAENVLHRLHLDARNDFLRMGKGIVKSVFRPMQPKDFEHVYLPITKEQGHYMRQIILDNNCKNVVEFGTSFGISTIYLADAVRQINGKVITTELIESKAIQATNNIEAAGLNPYVDVRIGDAMKTLRTLTEPIDFLFLDGWKDMYLPLFQMLEPLFHSNTLIYADNMDMNGTRHFADYVLNKTSVYATQRIENGKAFLTSVV